MKLLPNPARSSRARSIVSGVQNFLNLKNKGENKMETQSINQSIKNFTIEQLVELQEVINEELKLREAAGTGYFKMYELKEKAYYPCTYKQIQYAESLAKKTDSKIEPTKSQLLKKFEMEEMSEAIDLMKDGKRIKIF